MDINVRIAGAAGQGVETMGEMLNDAFAARGVHVFTTQVYMSRIRGGLNWFDLRISEHPLFSGREQVDLLVALRPEAREVLQGDMAPGGLVLLGDGAQEGAIAIDFAAVAQEAGGAKVMANAVAAGAVFGLLGYDLAPLLARLEATFRAQKGQEVFDANVRCAQRGAELARPHAGTLAAPQPVAAPAFTLSGSEALAYGLATAGVRFVAAYPMTPSTGLFTKLAALQSEYGIRVEQAEDEIAAINMVIGATYAGAPAATMTSGGGFALMVEGVSLAGMMELPALIVLGMRPGPATGLPTRTAQQDLRFALHAGHGEFPKALYAPGTLPQAFALARHALEEAHRFQTPVIVLSDQYLVDIRTNLPPLDFTLRPIDRHLLDNPGPEYRRYALTDSGVSPRALPGSAAFVVMDSDEHTEEGHLTEDLTVRVQMQEKRRRKFESMQAAALPPEWYGPPEAADVLICWGSTYGPVREAVDRLNEAGRATAMLHFSQLWPLPVDVIRALLSRARRVTCVEGNQTGQFAGLLREVGALQTCELMTRFDGLPFTGEEIARRLAL